MADQPAVPDDDEIDRTDRRGIRRYLVEQIEHGFLVGKGDVDAGEAEPPDALEQDLQLVASGAGDFDELIVAVQAKRLGRPFVHGRRGRVRDRRTEQSSEKAAL